MKRHPALEPLSHDHHRALVLARRLRRAADEPGGALRELEHAVQREFEAELDPHFRVEERCLLPALREAGADASVRRTEEDHARLRALVGGEEAPWSAARARELGALLEAHVRFEERELFPQAEARLSEDALDAVRRAALAAAARPAERDEPEGGDAP